MNPVRPLQLILLFFLVCCVGPARGQVRTQAIAPYVKEIHREIFYRTGDGQSSRYYVEEGEWKH